MANGSPASPSSTCPNASILVTQNIIRGNFVGMMAYFHAQAIVRKQRVLDNRFAFVPIT